MAQNGNPRLALIGLSRTRPWSSQMVGSEYSRLSSLFAASSPAVPGVPIVEGGAKLESGKEIWRKRSRGRDELTPYPLSRRPWTPGTGYAAREISRERSLRLKDRRDFRRRDGKENGNISLPFWHEYDVKLPNLAF